MCRAGIESNFIFCRELQSGKVVILVGHLLNTVDWQAFTGCRDNHFVEKVGDDFVTVAVMPIRLPSRASAQIMRAPVYVFPAPGGPWTGKAPWSKSRAKRQKTMRVAAR
jgi:hypothetical protein